MGKHRIIDLSKHLKTTPYGVFPWAEIVYGEHRGTAKVRMKNYGVPKGFYPDDMGAADETVYCTTHTGTHLDAPWHYGPTSEGKPAKTIDEIPLEWCYGDGVVIDVKHKKPLEFITSEDVKKALDKIKYKLKPMDIVLVKTGAPSMTEAPGPGREVTMWLIDQGIKVMGIDLAGWERALPVMLAEYKSGKPKGQYWQAHLAGREREYCQIEGLTNLDAIPKPYGFKVSVLPIKVLAASAAWCRAVAILEE